MRRLAAVVAAAVTGLGAAAQAPAGWRGPGWYQVEQTASGLRLQAGPYRNELACKKALNAPAGALACRELAAPPAGG